MKVGIIGYGWVGKASKELFKDALVYDPYLPTLAALAGITTSQENINKCDIAIVGVPTPPSEDGTLDTSIVEEVISWCECPIILLRSTVNPGTVDYLKTKYKKRIVFQPEYLGETAAHPNSKMSDRNFIILGGDDNDIRAIIDLYSTVYNANVTIRQVTAREAEIIKLTENLAIGSKVMLCHELYLACKADGTNYYRIRDAVFHDDYRFNLWFTLIYKDEFGNEKLGFNNSKCLLKDIPAWAAWAESVKVDPVIARSLVRRSREMFGKSADQLIMEHMLMNYRSENGVYS